MKFDEPSEILTQITQIQLATQPLQQNRTLINRLFNGETPWTAEEARENATLTNVNWLQGTRVASNATNQLNNAFFAGDRFFTLRLDKGPKRLRAAYSELATKAVNKVLKRNRAYRSARESAHAQVVLHGAGPLPWRNRMTPTPSTGGIEDVLIPAGTLCDMCNLDRFALYRELTWGELEKAAFGKVVDPGWNKEYVKALLATMYKSGFQPIYQGNRWLFPEKLAEDYKEGATWSISSSLPKVLAWDFFFLDEDTMKWNRRLIVDFANFGTMGLKGSEDVVKKQQVLYEKDAYADDWSEIIHWYIGNCSNVAPYRYHSIRSMGYLLFGPCMMLNKLLNRDFDHMFQQLLTLFRNVSEDNREKLGLIDLQNFGILPDGVTMVAAAERYLVDPRFIQMGIDQATQMIAQSAMNFVPDMQGGATDRKTMTATETLVRQNTSITMTSAVLKQLGDQSLYEYMEIWRRFCIKGNSDPMVKQLREDLKEEGVPVDTLLEDAEAWEVLPELAVGGGSKAVELTVTQALLQEVYPLVDPQAQRLILRRRYNALTDNPEEALLVVPEVSPVEQGPDMQQAQQAFSVLMLGVPFQDREGTSHLVMAQVLMQLSGLTLQQAAAAVQQPLGVGMAAEKVVGVTNVLQHVQQEIMKLAQAQEQPGQKEQAKALGKQWEELQAALQQVAKAVQSAEEQMAQQSGAGGEEQAKLMAKLQEIQATAEVQRQIAGASAQQKQEQKQIGWAEENARRNADTAAQIERDNAKTVAELQHANARTAVELQNSLVKTKAEVEMNKAKEASKPKPAAK